MFYKILIFILLTSINFVHTSQQKLTTEQQCASFLMRTGHNWLFAQSKNFTAIGFNHHKNEKRLPLYANITESSFSLQTENGTTLIISRRTEYYYRFSFTPNATPENLQNTPLSGLLAYLKEKFLTQEERRISKIKIPISNNVSFACENSDGYIHCVQQEA